MSRQVVCCFSFSCRILLSLNGTFVRFKNAMYVGWIVDSVAPLRKFNARFTVGGPLLIFCVPNRFLLYVTIES